MSHPVIRAGERYAWHGQSLLVTTERGDCGDELSLSGWYFREARHLRTLRLEIDGERPWLCASDDGEPMRLDFCYIHPELTHFGGGGTGQSGDETTTDRSGIPHRALDLLVRCDVGIASLDVTARITNRSQRCVTFRVGWVVDADYADIQEAQSGRRRQSAPVRATACGDTLTFAYEHADLPYRTIVRASADDEPPARACREPWAADARGLFTTLTLDTQETRTVTLHVEPVPLDDPLDADSVAERDRHWRRWTERLAHVEIPRNRVAELTVADNLRDFASFPLLQGAPDEWLTPQAGMPVYPALFGRDALTSGWQAGWVDGCALLDSALHRLGRMQGHAFDAWRDEQPGRLPYQVRQGPLERLNLNPYAAYYADFATPLMYVISLAQLYAWTGDKQRVKRHWDVARRVLDWARDYGDRDGDGYLEYLTVSADGTKNQGWKDSGNAIVYEDGTPVPDPLGTCELQGYWYAAQQLFAVLCFAFGQEHDARAYWESAKALKERFNREWWLEDERYFALALDPHKRRVRALTSNVGQCITTGIIDDEHLPAVVGRMFAPDLFSGFGVRTLSTGHRAYNPLAYHLGTVWAVENATIAFGLRRFGFDARAVDLCEGLFALARRYPQHRIPECVGGYARDARPSPGAYPRANTPQLWNASGFSLLMQTLLGLQPVAPLELLAFDPVLPEWMPEVIVHDLRLGGTTATLRFWRDDDGDCHGEVVKAKGTLHLIKQPPPEDMKAGIGDRFAALVDTVVH